MRRPSCAAAIFCLSLAASQGAGAESLADPFGTGKLVAASPAGRQGGDCGEPLPQGALGLAQAVDLALCNNPRTRVAWTSARYQAAQVGVAQSAYWPSVSATVSASRQSQNTGVGSADYNQHSAGAGLSWLLWDFGGRAAGLESARRLLDAANASQDATLQAVFLDTTQAYYLLQATDANVVAAQATEASAKESLNAATARYAAGVATPADKLQAQTAWSQAVLARIRAEGEARNARGGLANAMGLDPTVPFTLPPPTPAIAEEDFQRDVGRLIDEARARRPDLRAAESQVAAARAGVEVARSAGLPSLSLGSAYNATGSGIADSLQGGSIGLTVNFPLFTGYANTYQRRAAKAQVESALAQRDQLSSQVALDVWRAWQNLQMETQAVHSSADLVESAKASEAVTMGRYKAGVGNVLDLLSAQSALASARQQRILAIYNWYVARASLAKAMGNLDLAAVAPVAAPSNQPAVQP